MIVENQNPMALLKEIGIDSRGLDGDLDLRFRLESRHIAALVERFIPRLKTPNFWKIEVICSLKSPVRNLNASGGVFEVYIPIDPKGFFKLDIGGKKKFVLEALKIGLQLASEHTGIGRGEFPHAICKSETLINEYAFPSSPRSSPNRKWKAHLWCSHEIDHFTAHLVVMDRQMAELARVFLFKVKPCEFKFVRLMDVPYWVTNDEIDVCRKSWKWNPERRTLKKFDPESDSSVS